MADREVQYVTLSGGKTIAAYKLTCPDCRALDLNTEVDTNTHPWTAWCSNGHEFKIDPRPDA